MNNFIEDIFDEKLIKCSHCCEGWLVDKILEFAGTSFFQSECTVRCFVAKRRVEVKGELFYHSSPLFNHFIIYKSSSNKLRIVTFESGAEEVWYSRFLGDFLSNFD